MTKIYPKKTKIANKTDEKYEKILTEKLLRNIGQEISEGILLLGDDYKILWANKVFLDQNCCRLEEILGKRCYQITHNRGEPQNTSSPCPVRKIKKGAEPLSLIHSYQGKNIAISAYPITDDKGRIIQFVHVGKDIISHKQSEDLLKKSNYDLELWVEKLKKEIEERKKVEKKLLENRKRLRYLAIELSLTEERERRTIASELHERIGQALAITKIKLKTLQAANSQYNSDDMGEIIGIIEQTIQDTRTLSFEISPPILHKFGLVATLEWLLEKIQKQHGIAVEIHKESFSQVERNLEIILFQIVRELLMNVIKHAQAQKTSISIKKEGDYLKIIVEDDGKGFDVSKIDAYSHEGFGLFSICERLEHIGGHIEFKSKPGFTQASLMVPLVKND